VGDLGQRVAFGLREGSILFSGEPFWHAWRAKHRTAADDAKRDALVDRYERTRLSYNALVDSVDSGLAGEPARARLTAMRSELELLDNQLTELEAIEDMPEYSRALTGHIRLLDGVNPVVYRTLTTVMHYRALFKHFQQRNPVGFSAFVDSLKRVPVEPAVTTPTIQPVAAPQP
jgi:hypothetical protein